LAFLAFFAFFAFLPFETVTGALAFSSSCHALAHEKAFCHVWADCLSFCD
jgi:hypothetical protein